MECEGGRAVGVVSGVWALCGVVASRLGVWHVCILFVCRVNLWDFGSDCRSTLISIQIVENTKIHYTPTREVSGKYAAQCARSVVLLLL